MTIDIGARIDRIGEFADALTRWFNQGDAETRSYINRNLRLIRNEVIEAGCLKTYTIGPPPITGGLVMRNVDPFTCIYQSPYGESMIPQIIDMLDETIGVMSEPGYGAQAKEPDIQTRIFEKNLQKGYVFIAMPMAGNKPEYDDVHDAIKQAAHNCGLTAERVDEIQSNERITDRLLESIRKAEFVIADLTDSKPNVFYEAGYAFGLGKTPIYVARTGTKLEFDLKDYPIIFFGNMRQLRVGLEERLRAIKH